MNRVKICLTSIRRVLHGLIIKKKRSWRKTLIVEDMFRIIMLFLCTLQCNTSQLNINISVNFMAQTKIIEDRNKATEIININC